MERMRILATCQYGWPEPYPSLLPMEEMAKRGHHVHAVTGTPNYPMGEVFDGYEHNRVREEDHNGVHITHVPVIPRRQDPVHRLMNYHSYPVTARRRLMRLDGSYDVVFANQSSPVMMVEPAIAYARKWGRRVVMYCMDLWPASLCIGGVRRGSAVYRFYRGISKRVYENVDVILVTSRMFRDYFVSEFGIPERKIDYLPQYALSEFDSVPEQRDKEKATTDFVFAGNVGAAQNLQVLLRAAKAIEDEGMADHGKRIVFHIVGDGQQLGSLQGYARENGIGNVVFHGRKPAEEMPAYYAMADAMVVTMIPDPLISLTLPAKVQGYMAAGRPIIACADGEAASVVSESGCGFCARADDDRGLVEAVRAFTGCGDRAALGRRARDYYSATFSVGRVMDKLEGILAENCRR